MKISILIKDLQHIEDGKIDFNFSERNIICLTGKNGVGKTSIIKVLYLMKDIGIFDKNKYFSPIDENTLINIDVNGNSVSYKYMNDGLDSKDKIDKSLLHVELPIPNGERFSRFSLLNGRDKDIREKFIKKDMEKPVELINFLRNIYKTDKFNELKEVCVNNNYYYVVPFGNKYLREDYMSSGEYFIINLYKMFKLENNFIVIDEIDISLDASAQVSLMKELNKLCEKHNKKILFTSHSLAIMKTLYQDIGESIYYLSNKDRKLTLQEVSYSFVECEMFGFTSYDKFILTEDIMLEKYIVRSISKLNINKRVKVLYIGGASNVNNLMKRNERDKFLGRKEDVIQVLDKDSKEKIRSENTLFIPFTYIEKEIYEKYNGKESKIKDLLNNQNINFSYPENCKDKYYTKLLLDAVNNYENFCLLLENGKEKEVDEFNQKLKEMLEC